ncbi:diacylglycerol kinase [Actinomycetospora endophytica]|uniref:Diacylglycerol kinase n=1 Tax=Actinomycetospora endophytica TaxID=2291215 RepID=A0ABS8PAE2_9PSEU|nr:diacylglycerol kinase family protein [Actinomycetospora endophytica]MCD2195226.1 diacylglycerol kinase [Actinomycetospora endophytica]
MTTAGPSSGDPRRPSAARRIAAAVALIALLAAVGGVVLGTLRNVGVLVLDVVLVVLAVQAGWIALVSRGARRVVAAALAVAALAAAVILLVVSLDAATTLRIVLVVLFAAISVAAARVALRPDAVRPSTGGRVGPARRGVLLMNPRSGGGKVGRFDLEAEAGRRGIRAVVLGPGDDLRELAEAAVAAGADVLGMAGGDGSQALVADVARRHGLAHVCVPAGTRNHLALDLGLDRNDVVAALDAYGEALEGRIDLARIGDRVFVNNASLGVYATIVQSDAYRDGKLATTTQMLPDLLGPDATRSDLRFERPDGRTRSSADMILVSNGEYTLETIGGFGSRPRLDTGRLGVVTVAVDRARDLSALMAAEATGRIRRFHGYAAWTTTEFVVDSSEPLLDVGVDGEALRLAPPLRFQTLPGALRVRTPLGAPGVSPAASAPGRLGTAVPALWGVLVGRARA